MTPQSGEIRKKQLIHLLIQNGIYKKSTRHLYELSLTELESEYKHVRREPEHVEA
ncbi:Fur-regulated basic protein FbpA [Bacillus vallismortis]|uniref:Fur-regulated basic protein FbpA n=1 Tax=Bacillus vallismortis TaxID=72361 RepID=A0ABY4Y059_BACVA|nr:MULTISPECIES: Fur-regulated basic protein FbpA [Bacillus]MBL3649695.1 Fur-regulated basic protein FbpA [Bacillus sp. RHFS10]MDM5300561.1 Fur-regulated basic protein FbpA [Bacillus subtilis]MDM5322614.1 Fur-regulated basic protein FbpA [Bacillus subtilis]TYS09656.1 Fur-regulated basic protein FbpA [Bacillus subtilis]USP95973.1 Fur-regulated basic protein FbpA [Bacillus vallismortis]